MPEHKELIILQKKSLGLIQILFGALCCFIRNQPHLNTLDLSENDIDSETSNGLVRYLSNRQCPLKHLHLARADVDDFEAKPFFDVLHHNHTLETLNLMVRGVDRLRETPLVIFCTISGFFSITIYLIIIRGVVSVSVILLC